MRRIPSSDGVEVAVHELGGDPSLPPLLLSHATGFHAHCYAPIAAAVADRYHGLGLDYRGHGDTAAPPEWQVDWRRFGDDAVAVAADLVERAGRPIVGFGHSMGGAALLMAAARRPELIERLVLFEPIASGWRREQVDMEGLPIVQGARRRRRRFDSSDHAYENYSAKPPMSLMTPEVLRNYVDHGFRPVATDGSGGVELKCAPELEAGVFVASRRNGVWDLLPTIATPTLVVSGFVQEMQPSEWCEAIAARLPDARWLRLDHLSHFGPFSHPLELAELLDP